MFFRNKTGPIDFLVVGLGNPGKKYAHTRHNVGFDALDVMADEWSIDVKRSRFDALTGAGSAGGHKLLLMKPQTFMNLSGVSVQQAAAFYKLPAEKVLVLTDDVTQSPGTLRIRKNGSAGGHNGLKSIIAAIGEDFPRIRIGVGERPHPDYDLADWVTGHFSPDDRKAVEARYTDVAKAALLVFEDKFDEAMGLYNGEGKPGR